MFAVPLMTASERVDIPDDDYRYELVRGTLRRMPPSGWMVGVARARIGARFVEYADGSGGVVTSMSGYLLERDPDTVLAPDVAYVAPDRTGWLSGKWYYPPIAPDVVVMTVGWPDTPSDRLPNVRIYRDAGTSMVLFAEVERKLLTAEYADGHSKVMHEGDIFDGRDVMPGFRSPVSEFFRR